MTAGNTLTAQGISSYSPESYVQVSGDAGTLIINVPPYFDEDIPVEIIASDGANQRQILSDGITYTPKLTPGWHFDIDAVFAGFNPIDFETTLNPICFNTSNLTADNFYMKLVQ